MFVLSRKGCGSSCRQAVPFGRGRHGSLEQRGGVGGRVFGCGEFASTLRLLVHDELRFSDHAMSVWTLGVDGGRIGRSCGMG